VFLATAEDLAAGQASPGSFSFGQAALRELSPAEFKLALDRLKTQAGLARALKNNQATGRFASGGAIFGAGSSTADNIPILASSGEFVIRAQAAKSLGAARLEYMNRAGKLPRFQSGGPVSGGIPLGEPASVDTESISRAISAALDEAASRFVEKLSQVEIPVKAPTAEQLTLRVPDLPQLRSGESSGGPGAARLSAVEGSVDVIRDEVRGLKSRISEAGGLTSEEVQRIVDTSRYTSESEGQTELNDRISSILEEIKAEIDAKLSRQLSDVKFSITEVENIARQASSTASDALSRSMRSQ
jgi:hypothetical protein